MMEETKKLYSRRDSICPTPADALLEAVKSNKFNKVRSLVDSNEDLLSYDYPYPYFGKILYIACSEESISVETISTLLELGARVCDETEDQGEAIHVVSKLTRANVLKVLVRYLTKEEINHTFKGNNALLILIKEGNYSKKSELLECAKILVESGINVNLVDFKNLTSILWAIKKDCIDLVETLINNSSDLDIDSYTLNGKSARELIIWKYSARVTLPNTLTNNVEPKDLLLSYLKAYNEDAFIAYNQGDLSQYKDSDDTTYTLLQLSCQLGLLKAVTHLIQNKADLRKSTQKEPRTPLELASENGYNEIVDLLLKTDPHLKVSGDVLSTVISRIDSSDDGDDTYEKCFFALMDNQDEVNLNKGNYLSQTPLHLAVKFAKTEHVLKLLNKGASLAKKNEFDIMPIENIDAEVLEDHLDQCVDINDKDKNNVFVTLKYRTLMPAPLMQESNSQTCCEEGKTNTVLNPTPETDAIFYMSKTPHLRHLLTHPVIVTFLLLKWYKIYKLFLINVIFYVTFMISLFCYIFASYGNFNYIPDNQSVLQPIASISLVILCITYVLLIMRECFQSLVSPLDYYNELDNWIEVLLIFTVGFIIFIKDPSNDTRKQLSSIAILLSAFELIVMIGQHPRLTTNVVMFKRVSFNFLTFLAWYFLLIAAFALSFYILFSENGNDEGGNSTISDQENDKQEEETNFFKNPGIALFKTLVMLTGEFDASGMNFHSFPITSKVIFILFVLMIALVLLNLLNGLAVNDTQSIKNDAECVGLISRTEYVHYVETMFLGNIIPTNFFKLFQKMCCCFPMDDTPTVILGKTFSDYVLMYPKSDIIIPMSNDIETLTHDKRGSKKKKSFSVFTSLYLDKEIRRKVKKVLQKQRAVNNEQFLRNKIKKLQMEQTNIINALNQIKDKLGIADDKN